MHPVRVASWIFILCGSVMLGDDVCRAVIFNGVSAGKTPGRVRNYPELSLEDEFGIEESRYWPAETGFLAIAFEEAGESLERWRKTYVARYRLLDDTFVENLRRSKLLYIGQYCGDQSREIFANAEYRNAVEEFLSAGGTLFLDYVAVRPTLTPHLESWGVVNPWPTWSDYRERGTGAWTVKVAGDALRLTTWPNRIAGEREAQNWYGAVGAGQEAVFVGVTDPQRIGMLVQRNVKGKGTVVFNQLPAVFRKTRHDRRLLENVLSSAFDRDIREYRKQRLLDEGGPGELIEQQ